MSHLRSTLVHVRLLTVPAAHPPPRLPRWPALSAGMREALGILAAALVATTAVLLGVMTAHTAALARHTLPLNEARSVAAQAQTSQAVAAYQADAQSPRFQLLRTDVVQSASAGFSRTAR